MDKKKVETPLVKIGSEDMLYWKLIVDARKEDIKASEGNLKYFKAILEMAETKYQEAEKVWNKK